MDLFIGTKQRDCDQSYIEYLENNEKFFFFYPSPSNFYLANRNI